jgi:predicted nucleotide-binding protein
MIHQVYDDPRFVFDKDEAWIKQHIVDSRREGRDILFNGVVASWENIREIHITYTDQTYRLAPRTRKVPGLLSMGRGEPTWLEIPMSVMETLEALGSVDVTDQFITGPPGRDLSAFPLGTGVTHSPRQGPARATNRKAVMIIYGHDDEANNAMFSWLRDIGLQPQEWSQLIDLSDSASPYIGNVLERTFESVQAVVALFTPDEFVRERDTRPGTTRPWRFQARPNVLIEAGMALVTHPDRTILVILGPQELPSDLAGRHYIRLDGTSGPLNDMASRLKSAGCEVDQSGTRWLDPSRFPDRDHIPTRPSI